jgi:hypothetical protein
LPEVGEMLINQILIDMGKDGKDCLEPAFYPLRLSPGQKESQVRLERVQGTYR